MFKELFSELNDIVTPFGYNSHRNDDGELIINVDCDSWPELDAILKTFGKHHFKPEPKYFIYENKEHHSFEVSIVLARKVRTSRGKQSRKSTSTNTHKARVLEYLEKNGSITSMDAINEFGCTRLAVAIYQLRKDGYHIGTLRETDVNRYGKSVNFARYILNPNRLPSYDTSGYPGNGGEEDADTY